MTLENADDHTLPKINKTYTKSGKLGFRERVKINRSVSPPNNDNMKSLVDIRKKNQKKTKRMNDSINYEFRNNRIGCQKHLLKSKNKMSVQKLPSPSPLRTCEQVQSTQVTSKLRKRKIFENDYSVTKTLDGNSLI